MGIRVDAMAMDRQLRESGCDGRRALLFHRMLLSGELPLTIGAVLANPDFACCYWARHISGEVQSSLWDAGTLETCRAAGVEIL